MSIKKSAVREGGFCLMRTFCRQGGGGGMIPTDKTEPIRQQFCHRLWMLTTEQIQYFHINIHAKTGNIYIRLVKSWT